MTESKLAEAALHYLSRYASSSGNLRRVLLRKVARSAAYYGDDPAPLTHFIDELVLKYAANGAIDDAGFADAQIRKLRRRGGSARLIRQSLNSKGVPVDIIAEASSHLSDEAGDAAAALRFARRRRLGPFRQSGRADNRQRDLAALGRGGFDYAVAAMIIDAEDVEALAESVSPL